ncbi:hypothetical protein [Pseudomonas sp. ANT_H12B]|nr:hypothetical protein [Pseudomonas sp. ANT_H12B]
MPIALLALTLNAFVIVGLLPTFGADLGSSLPSASLLSTRVVACH